MVIFSPRAGAFFFINTIIQPIKSFASSFEALNFRGGVGIRTDVNREVKFL